MPNSIMDGFFKKVNLEWRPLARLDMVILKDRFYKNPSKNTRARATCAFVQPRYGC